MTDQADATYLLLQQRKPTSFFIRMVAASFVLHFLFSIMVMLPGRNSAQAPAPVFVELAQTPSTIATEPAPDASEVEDAQEESRAPAEMAAPEEPEAGPEMAKLAKGIETSLDQAASVPETIHQSSIGLGMTAGYFGSFSEGETLKDEIREYYFLLMRRINEAWWLSSRNSPLMGRGASINIMITREGKIVAAEILQGSGDADYDRLLMESLKKAGPLPPLPRSFPQRIFAAPIRFNPPLNLMLPRFSRKPVQSHGLM